MLDNDGVPYCAGEPAQNPRILTGMDHQLLLTVLAKVLMPVLRELPVPPETFCDQLAAELPNG